MTVPGSGIDANGRPRRSLIVIDDDPEHRLMLEDLFRDRGYEVTTAADGEEGLRLSDLRRPDLIILDVLLPGMSGIDVLAALKRQHPRLPVIVMSAGGDEVLDRATLAMYSRVQQGAARLIDKTISLKELAATVDEMLEGQP